MKTILSTLFFTILSLFIFAQNPFNTGNKELDQSMLTVNIAAKNDLDGFKSSLLKEGNGLTLNKIEELLKKLEPAEVLIAKDISVLSKKPLDTVIDAFEKDRKKGWGELAKEMGIKPGSKEFHQLKEKMKSKADENSGKGDKKAKSEEKNNGKGNGKGNGKK